MALTIVNIVLGIVTLINSTNEKSPRFSRALSLIAGVFSLTVGIIRLMNP